MDDDFKITEQMPTKEMWSKLLTVVLALSFSFLNGMAAWVFTATLFGP